MQKNTLTGMNLAADPAQSTPSPAAKVARLTRKRGRPAKRLEIIEEEPSEASRITVTRDPRPEQSVVECEAQLWPLRIRLKHTVGGRIGSLASTLTVVLVCSVMAGVTIPLVLFFSHSPAQTELFFGLCSEFMILCIGVGALMHWSPRRR